MVSMFVGPDQVPFRAHQSMLQRSALLASMICEKSLGDEIELPMESAAHFGKLLNYLYSSEYKVSNNTRTKIYELCDMLIVADRYGLPDLTEELVGHMRNFGHVGGFLTDYAKTFLDNVRKVYGCVSLEDGFIRGCVRYVMRKRNQVGNGIPESAFAVLRQHVESGGPLATDIFCGYGGRLS